MYVAYLTIVGASVCVVSLFAALVTGFGFLLFPVGVVLRVLLLSVVGPIHRLPLVRLLLALLATLRRHILHYLHIRT